MNTTTGAMSSPAPNSTLPPQSNPVLTAYEGFVGNTPLVSRYIMTTLLITWIISFFIDLSFSVSNIPYFSLGHFEVYRILFSSLICSNLFSLVFAYFSFVDHGKRLEFSMGSAQFAWLFFSLGTLTNVVHIAITYTLYLLSNNRSWVFVPASGIWTVLFGLIAIECVKAPTGSQRKLFIISIPTMQYPVVLCCLFSLLGGIQLAYFVSLGIGYAYGFGYLDRTKVSDAVSKRWEDSFLASLARQEGWVVGHAATGSDAWNDLGSGGATSAGPDLSSMFARTQGAGDTAGDIPVGSGSRDQFSSSSGRQLGGPTRRPAGAAEAREARLKALDVSSKNAENALGGKGKEEV